MILLTPNDRAALEVAAGVLKAYGRANLGERLRQIARRRDEQHPAPTRAPKVEPAWAPGESYAAVPPVVLVAVGELMELMRTSRDAREAVRMLFDVLILLGPELTRDALGFGQSNT